MHLSLELQTANYADLINPVSPAGLVFETSGHHNVWMSGGGVWSGEGKKAKTWPLGH